METIFTDGQLTKLIETMRQKQMTPERFNTILGSGILADILDPNADLGNRNAVRVALKLEVVMPDIFRFTVDYGQSLDQMIAVGHYDWMNDDITAKRFPIVGEGVVEFEARLFHFNRSISSETAVGKIKEADPENPWIPAKIEYLLAFGEKFSEEQRKFPIIGLGSVARVNDYRSVPYLYEDGSERDLSLDWWYGDWRSGCRFLAVRKVSVA